MAPLPLRLCVLALAGVAWALPQAPSSSLLLRRWECGPPAMTSGDVQLLSDPALGCVEVEECHFCCDLWDSQQDGDLCHDDGDVEGLCPGMFFVHCGLH